MSTNPHRNDLNEALPTKTYEKPHSIKVANGQIANNGDKVIDILSGLEGTLRYTWIAWLVKWSDGIETIVYDPSLLKLK